MKPEMDFKFKSAGETLKRNKALFARLGVIALAATAMTMSTRVATKDKESPKEVPVMNVRSLPSTPSYPDETPDTTKVIQFVPVEKTTVEEPVVEPTLEEPVVKEPAKEEQPAVKQPTIERPASGRPHTDPKDIVEPDPSELISSIPALGWDGPVLTPDSGHVNGPTGDETYYNLPMDYVVGRMRRMGNEDSYWIRQDGVKMLGNYVMVAADLDVHPRGSIVETTLGTGIVCDTGGFAKDHHQRLDIATVWEDPRKK